MASLTKKASLKSDGKRKSDASPAKRISPAKRVTKNPDGPFEDNFDSTLTDLFFSELKDMYWAENHLVSALPKMVDASEGPLKKALQDHWKETKNHVSRLENVFDITGKPILAKKCAAMEGLTISGENIIESTRTGSPGRKMGIIGSGLKVENFEITCYKGLIQMASALKMDEAVSLFQKTLQEETAAAEKLQMLQTGDDKK